ncbi:MAG: hypothetical protein V4475_01885 [Pseudomonadota bacterium]
MKASLLSSVAMPDGTELIVIVKDGGFKKTTAVALGIPQVLAISGAVGTVAANAAAVVAVGAAIDDVTDVAGSIANVALVGGSIANVNAVGGSIANVNSVAASIGAVTTVAGIVANIGTVAGIAAAITTVAGDHANIAAIAADLVNIDQVAGNLAAITGAIAAAATAGVFAIGAATDVPKGAASFSFTAGSGGTNSFNNLATFTGGTLTYNPVIYYDVVANAVTNVRMTFPGLYIGASTPTMPTVVLANGGTGTITLVQGRLFASGQGYWVAAADGRSLDRYYNAAGTATRDTSIDSITLRSALYDQRQTIGYPGPIPDGASNASAAYFLIYDPILGDGVITGFRGYFSGAGTASLQRYVQSGGNWVTVGAVTTVTIPGAGYRSIATVMPVNEGEFVAINCSVMRYVGTSVSTAPGDVSDGGGLFSGISNGAAIALVPSLAARLHVALDVQFRSKRAETRRNLITVQSSDKIVFPRNSYAEDIYSLRGKGYVQKVADLTAWRVENFSIQGNTNAALLASAQARTYLNGTLSLWDVGPKWIVAGEEENSSNNAGGAVSATVINNYRQLLQSLRSLGAGIILATEHTKTFVNGAIESGPALIRKMASEYGAVVHSVRANANKFSPQIGGYGSDYAGWNQGGGNPVHLNTRYNELLAQPFRELVATKLGRPAKSLRVFRPRPNADGTAPTIASKDALLFEPGDYYTRYTLFQEIAHGQRALGTTVEKYLDEINSGSITTPSLDTIPSEYLTLQVGRSLSFTDYAYVEAILEANGSDVTGIGVYVSDPAATVWVRTAFYTDATNTAPVAATAPTGRWKQLLIDSDGFARLSGRNVTSSVWGDEVCFLIVKAGAFTLTEPVIEWFGKPGKVQPPLKPTNTPNGAELVTSPYIVSAGALATGWAATGAPTFGTGIPSAGTPKMLPRGATGNVILSTADKVTTTLAWAADNYRDREIEIVVWAATPRALQDSTTWTRANGTITPFTNDLDKILVEIIGGTNAVPYDRLPVGLYYTEHRFRTWAPAGSTGFSIRLSAGVSSIAAAYLSAKFVEV